ncbi:hypothetical protein AV530_006118 [Patagioenas fasciata monilis]|uniref:Uncharacterized protein n=1 Tax=Patagioenas fasciata monilis TaxID=372326 RepID=A0A1V4J8R1_PATFA|nr:hypothetical protein AV530_006118 [Patagioenas fasciata monilis]
MKTAVGAPTGGAPLETRSWPRAPAYWPRLSAASVRYLILTIFIWDSATCTESHSAWPQKAWTEERAWYAEV